jgi:hypothetical protein
MKLVLNPVRVKRVVVAAVQLHQDKRDFVSVSGDYHWWAAQVRAL